MIYQRYTHSRAYMDACGSIDIADIEYSDTCDTRYSTTWKADSNYAVNAKCIAIDVEYSDT